MLLSPNPDGRDNRRVIRPWANGEDVNGRNRGLWIIDFGIDMSESEAALFEAPFEYVKRLVRPRRAASRTTISEWWLHERPRPELRAATAGLSRFLVTTRLSPHRLFAWLPAETLPDSRLIAFATSDDFMFGLLQSQVHETWSRNTSGAQRREAVSGFTYTPTTAFETFPFPDCAEVQRNTVAEAGRRLAELRRGWLDPPGLDPSMLQKRTLTSLYNERPTWLGNAHAELDAAVLNAYDWPASVTGPEILERLLAMNVERSMTSGTPAERS
jgi:hypothetical protein